MTNRSNKNILGALSLRSLVINYNYDKNIYRQAKKCSYAID